MGQIATKKWINSNKKTISGWAGNNECPTKSEIESADPSLKVLGSYASNQLVQQSDVLVYGWNYYFSSTPTSISDDGTGGIYLIYVNSKRVKTENGVETSTEEFIGWTFSESLSWVSGGIEYPLTSNSRLRVRVVGGYQIQRSSYISFQQTGTSNTFSVSVSQASRYILRYTGYSSNLGIGIFNTSVEPNPTIDYPHGMGSIGNSSGTLAIYGSNGMSIANQATGGITTAFIGNTVYVREKLGEPLGPWGPAIPVTLSIDTTVALS